MRDEDRASYRIGKRMIDAGNAEMEALALIPVTAFIIFGIF